MLLEGTPRAQGAGPGSIRDKVNEDPSSNQENRNNKHE